MTMKVPDLFVFTLTDDLQEVMFALEHNDGDGLEKAARKYKKLLLAVARAFRDNRAWAKEREDGYIELHMTFTLKEPNHDNGA